MRPPRVTGEAAIPEMVNRLIRKFEYRDADTIAQNPMLGGGGGMFTYAIAASNTIEVSSGKADQQATGINDDQTLMGGMGIVYTAGGGRLIISEGTYNIQTDEIVVGHLVGYQEPMILQGMGIATALATTTTATTSVIHVAGGSKVRDILVGVAGTGG